MKGMSVAVMSLLLMSMALAATDEGAPARTKANSEVTGPPPDWLAVQEDWWYPLKLDSADALSNARYYYRRDNEKAAADEIRRAASWMTYAAGHALENTSQALLRARTDLLTLADDLDAGSVAGAAELDEPLANASKALAEWHYYRAREEYAKREATNAAQDLEAAAAHLENAARSAHLQYGPDTITVFEDIYQDGKMISEGKTVDNDLLGKHLDGIDNAIQRMAAALK